MLALGILLGLWNSRKCDMFTKDQGKIKIMFQGAIQKNQNIIKKKITRVKDSLVYCE